MKGDTGWRWLATIWIPFGWRERFVKSGGGTGRLRVVAAIFLRARLGKSAQDQFNAKDKRWLVWAFQGELGLARSASTFSASLVNKPISADA